MTDQTAASAAYSNAKSSGATYKSAAIGLHWLLAAAIIGQIGLAWYMGALPEDSPAQDYVQTFHVSIGFTILALTIIRLIVRLTNPPPPLPADMAGWEKVISTIAHIAFYVLMIGIPITGWLMLPGFRPITVWGVSGMPHFPWFGELMRSLPRPQGFALRNNVELVHGTILVWTMIALIGLHVLGALKHQFDGHPVLYRMLPFLKPKGLAPPQ